MCVRERESVYVCVRERERERRERERERMKERLRERLRERERERESVVSHISIICCLNALAIQNVCFCHANKAF